MEQHANPVPCDEAAQAGRGVGRADLVLGRQHVPQLLRDAVPPAPIIARGAAKGLAGSSVDVTLVN